MGNIVAADIGYTAKQINQHITDNRPFGLDGYRYEHDVQLRVGKEVSKGRHDTHDGTGSTNSRRTAARSILHTQMKRCSTNAAEEIKHQETFRAPDVFQYPPKHPKGEHVEEDVGDTAMCEHVRGNLVRLKKN